MPKDRKNFVKVLERRISDHFYEEAKIVRDILNANLTEEETEELDQYMKKHPYAKLVDSASKETEKGES